MLSLYLQRLVNYAAVLAKVSIRPLLFYHRLVDGRCYLCKVDQIATPIFAKIIRWQLLSLLRSVDGRFCTCKGSQITAAVVLAKANRWPLQFSQMLVNSSCCPYKGQQMAAAVLCVLCKKDRRPLPFMHGMNDRFCSSLISTAFQKLICSRPAPWKNYYYSTTVT